MIHKQRGTFSSKLSWGTVKFVPAMPKVGEIIRAEIATHARVDSLRTQAPDQLMPKQEVSRRDTKGTSLSLRSVSCTSEADFAGVGLTIQDVVKISIDKQPLVDKRQSFITLMQEAEDQQNPSKPNSPAQKKLAAQKEIEELQTKLDEPNKQYQAYLIALKDWEKRLRLRLVRA